MWLLSNSILYFSLNSRLKSLNSCSLRCCVGENRNRKHLNSSVCLESTNSLWLMIAHIFYPLAKQPPTSGCCTQRECFMPFSRRSRLNGNVFRSLIYLMISARWESGSSQRNHRVPVFLARVERDPLSIKRKNSFANKTAQGKFRWNFLGKSTARL